VIGTTDVADNRSEDLLGSSAFDESPPPQLTRPRTAHPNTAHLAKIALITLPRLI
jgi:hypothetical protein